MADIRNVGAYGNPLAANNCMRRRRRYACARCNFGPDDRTEGHDCADYRACSNTGAHHRCKGYDCPNDRAKGYDRAKGHGGAKSHGHAHGGAKSHGHAHGGADGNRNANNPPPHS